MSIYKYFTIPFKSLPVKPPYTVWFATWSTERPIIGPGMAPPMVVGVTSAETLPPGATVLTSGSKDPPPPPPPLRIDSQADYRKLVEQWLQGDRSEDE